MKSQTIRYLEAVERNLNSAKKNRKKYHGLKLEEAKVKLGIRSLDQRFDTEVLDIISLP